MTFEQSVLTCVSLAAVAVMAAMGVVVCVTEFHLSAIRQSLQDFRRLPWYAQLFLVAFVSHFVVYGSVKTNQTDNAGGDVTNAPLMMLMMSRPAAQPTVTEAEISRGWQLVEVRTNEVVDYTMPQTASLDANWWVRGAFDDARWLSLSASTLSGWRFPFGGGEYDSIWALVWGELRFVLGDASTEISAVGSPMSAVPYRSRLWIADGTDGSRLVTWEDFALNRDPDTPINAQIVLFRNGDFVTRSNDVETVFRRVDPEDWDDDGIPNVDDPHPYSSDGDFFGPRQSLPAGANADAYCWVELVSEVNSHVTFTGDGPSDLPDPDFMVRADETNRVILLIGKTYSVASSRPVSVVAKSDPAIEVTGDGTCGLGICWPVEFTVGDGMAPSGLLGATWNEGGRAFHVLTTPSFLGGEFAWDDGGCCSVLGDGVDFAFQCDNDCTCEGCTAYGYYGYEGYRLPLGGVSCGCGYVEDHGDASVEISFDRSVALFEGIYTNAPGEVITPIPSNVVLTCHAYGGTYGGQLSVWVETGGRISKVSGDSLPVEVSLAAGEERTYEVVYCPIEGSCQEGDVLASAGIVENFTGGTYGEISELTVVRVEIQCIVEAPTNSCPNRHKFGVGENVRCNLHPNVSSVSWVSRCGSWENADEFVCPLTATNDPIAAVCGDFSYTPSIAVIEPNGIETRNPGCVTYGVQPGRAGWVGLRQDYYVLPLDVSFTGISIEEVPCTRGTRSGYFNNSQFDVISCHSRAMGAGRWLSVGLDNKAGLYDTSSMTMELMRVNAAGDFTEDTNCCWTAGSVIWDIPFGWGPTNNVCNTEEVLPVGLFCQDIKQHFEINQEGDVTVRKFGNSAERLITGQLKLNGELWGVQ